MKFLNLPKKTKNNLINQYIYNIYKIKIMIFQINNISYNNIMLLVIKKV